MVGIGIAIIIIILIVLASNKKTLDPFEELKRITIVNKRTPNINFAIDAFNEIKAKAENRDFKVYWRVGDFYKTGNISFDNDQLFPKNKAKALWWKTKGAEDGDATCQYLLGIMYYFGDDLVKPDTYEAIKWFERSADNGVLLPLVELGSIYFYGSTDKIQIDYKKAFEYLSRAVEHKDVKSYGISHTVAQVGLYNSALLLGELYALGNGVEQDLIQAYKWCKIGGEDPDTYPKYPLKDKLSNDDKLISEKLIEEWSKRP